jgi:hypothetical protein
MLCLRSGSTGLDNNHNSSNSNGSNNSNSNNSNDRVKVGSTF